MSKKKKNQGHGGHGSHSAKKSHKTHHPKSGKPHSAKKKHRIKKILDGGKEKALMLLFLPFSPIARTFLKKKGIKPANKPKEVLVQVFNETKKKSFGMFPHHKFPHRSEPVLAPQDSFDFGDTSGEFGLIEEMGFSQEEYGFVPITPGMIQGVIAFLKTIFDKIKAKKAAAAKALAEGKEVPEEDKLTPEEKEIADKAPQLEKDLEEVKQKAAEVDAEAQKEAEKEAEKPEGGITLPGGLTLSRPMLIGLLILIVLLLFMRGKK